MFDARFPSESNLGRNGSRTGPAESVIGKRRPRCPGPARQVRRHRPPNESWACTVAARHSGKNFDADTSDIIPDVSVVLR